MRIAGLIAPSALVIMVAGATVLQNTPPLRLHWTKFVSPKDADAVAEETPLAGSTGVNRRAWLHLRSKGDAVAGANSKPLPGPAGRLRFEYRADRAAPSGDNLAVNVIPLDGDGKEDRSAGRTTFTISKTVIGDGKIHAGTLDYDYLGKKGLRLILGPRINESGGRGPGELWIGRVWRDPLPASLEVVQFGPAQPLVPPDRPAIVRAVLKNAGGEPAALKNLRIRAEGATVRTVNPPADPLPPAQTARLEWRVTPARAGIIDLSLKSDDQSPDPLASSVLGASGNEGEASLTGDGPPFRLRETAPASRADSRIVSAALGSRGEAALFPLASFVLRSGETFHLQPLRSAARVKNGSEIVLEQRGRTHDGAAYILTATFRRRGNAEIVAEYRLQADRDLQLLRFTGPTLRIGEGAKRDWAHFPGLEYLVGDQRSSENAGDPDRLRLRFLPHPYKVTQPWMAVGVKGRAVGLAWDPNQPWTTGKADSPSVPRGLQPLFAVPDFLEGQDGSLLSLSLPTVGEGVEENARNLRAKTPLRLSKGRSLLIRARIFVRPASNAADAAALGWTLAPPAPLPISADLRRSALRLSLRSFVEQLWVPSARGWRMHLPLSFKSLSQPIGSTEAARAVWIAAESLPESDSLRRTAQAQARTVVERALAGNGPLDLSALEAAKTLGLPVEPLLPRVRRGLEGILRSQGADGAWRFHPDAEHAALGEAGGTATGLIADNAASLLRFAEISGDSEAKEAGLKAARFMETLPRPEGSQVWEVPLHVPDILAAGREVGAYLAAYRLTRDDHWKRRAIEAGKSGLTFVYTWAAPGRSIMRYGTIPVYGSTFHVLPWYGRLVQWNGLAYAAEVAHLAPVDPSFPWREVAEGITACGVQLQRKEGQTMFGLYPDVWGIEANREPSSVPYISPHLVLEALNALASPA
jgi:hypothetical protein